MPARPRRIKPRRAKPLPPGITRHDIDEEVLAEWQRDRWRQRKDAHRAKLARAGVRETSVRWQPDVLAWIEDQRGDMPRDYFLNRLLRALMETASGQ